MARNYRTRDVKGQPERLLRAVGHILRQGGHRALTINAIASESGVGKRYIPELFGGKFDLLRAFFWRYDFWLPRLAKERGRSEPKGEALLQLIIALLQDNFREFLKNEQLRNLILWQVSEGHELLWEINEKREAEGERIMRLARAHFEGSGIDLYTVIGTALGGGYFYGLQAATGNGPVAGRDMNAPEDVETALRTFGQMLRLFWWAAEAKKNAKLPKGLANCIDFI